MTIKVKTHFSTANLGYNCAHVRYKAESFLILQAFDINLVKTGHIYNCLQQDKEDGCDFEGSGVEDTGVARMRKGETSLREHKGKSKIGDCFLSEGRKDQRKSLLSWLEIIDPPKPQRVKNILT